MVPSKEIRGRTLKIPPATCYGRMACAWRRATVVAAELASWMMMSTSQSRRFPVTITHLPVTRCQICHRTVAYRPGTLSEVLTEHYRRVHPQALSIPTR
jgi:hypothetical protein